MSTKVTLPRNLQTIRTIGPIVGGVGLVAGIALALLFEKNLSMFFEASLYSFWILLGLSLGSFAFLMIHHMTIGAWSFVSQRIFEAFTRSLPVVAGIFAVCVLTGPWFSWNSLYDAWVLEENRSHVVGNKIAYLNPGFWSIRSIFYFAVWFVLIYMFNGWSKKLEETGDALITLRFQKIAPVGLIIYALTMTFAGADWGMSLEPEWFSTMYAPLNWISQGLTVLAVTLLILISLSDEKPLSKYITVEHYHTLATLMCGFVVLWAYMSFSQFLITWSGNLPEEIHYYLDRRGSDFYAVVTFLLMVGHFFIPLLILLQRRVKYSTSLVRKVCYWMLGMRLVDVFFVINPAFHHGDPSIPITDIIVHIFVLAGFGGIYMWYFLGQLTKMPLLPMNDPRLYNAVGYGEGEEAIEHA